MNFDIPKNNADNPVFYDWWFKRSIFEDKRHERWLKKDGIWDTHRKKIIVGTQVVSFGTLPNS